MKKKIIEEMKLERERVQTKVTMPENKATIDQIIVKKRKALFHHDKHLRYDEGGGFPSKKKTLHQL